MGSKVEMHLGPGRDNSVVLDGHDITRALSGINLLMGADGLGPSLVLELVLPEVTVRGQMQVRLSDGTQELLVRAGWTPPTE